MIAAISSSSSRIAACRLAFRSVRTFSTECAPAQRLRDALADYKKIHFSRETPRRFKKEVLMPYTVDNSIDVDQLNRLLTNIGHSEDCLSAKEQSQLLQEAGCTGRSIPVPKLTELID